MHIRMSCFWRLLMLSPLLLQSGCGRSLSPGGWSADINESQTQGYGSWAIVKLHAYDSEEFWAGELIAIDADSLYLLQAGELLEIPTQSVTQIRIQTWEIDRTSNATFSTLGALSTASHGFLALYTLPMWIVFSVISDHEVTRGTRFEADENTVLSEVAKWARFPNGLPADFSLASLRPKGFVPPPELPPEVPRIGR